jgi:acyl-ACP thioesterase
VNNAAYWAVVEEQLARRRDLRAPLRAVAEFRSGIRRDDDVQVLATETPTSVSMWLVVAGAVRATLEVTA